jgi:hypothetical protein
MRSGKTKKIGLKCSGENRMKVKAWHEASVVSSVEETDGKRKLGKNGFSLRGCDQLRQP